MKEIEKFVQKEVVQRLLRLIKFRNEYPAFDGEFECTLQVNLNNYEVSIE